MAHNVDPLGSLPDSIDFWQRQVDDDERRRDKTHSWLAIAALALVLFLLIWMVTVALTMSRGVG